MQDAVDHRAEQARRSVDRLHEEIDADGEDTVDEHVAEGPLVQQLVHAETHLDIQQDFNCEAEKNYFIVRRVLHLDLP